MEIIVVYYISEAFLNNKTEWNLLNEPQCRVTEFHIKSVFFPAVALYQNLYPFIQSRCQP